MGGRKRAEPAGENLTGKVTHICKQRNAPIVDIIAAPKGTSYENLCMVLNDFEVNVYDTDGLGEGHLDLISSFAFTEDEIPLVKEVNWITQEADDNEAFILIILGRLELLFVSLQLSQVISQSKLPQEFTHISIIDGKILLFDKTGALFASYNYDGTILPIHAQNRKLAKSHEKISRSTKAQVCKQRWLVGDKNGTLSLYKIN